MIEVWELLPALGFSTDPDVMSGRMPGLSFDFGNLKLSASHVLNRGFMPVVMLTGVLATERTLSEICCDLPQKVDSREQCLALISYYLDKAARGNFEPTIAPSWLAEGREYQHLLPWNRAEQS